MIIDLAAGALRIFLNCPYITRIYEHSTIKDGSDIEPQLGIQLEFDIAWLIR
jgi:hypothetical protein